MIVTDHDLSNEEVGRYRRQILVQKFGVRGQEKLRATSLLIVGAGGLGCPVALYCAGAGIGHIGIVDGDLISVDNLHRQIAYNESVVGQSKVEFLKKTIQRLNSNVHVQIYKNYLFHSNALDIISKYDIVADCTDNISTRYLVSDACILMKKPLVSGSVVCWDGQLSVYGYGENCPCFRCLYPDPPAMDSLTNCSETGVIGPVVGIIGSMQANEVIRIAAIGTCSFAGSLYVFDAFNGIAKTVKLRRRRNDCLVCGTNATITTLDNCKNLYRCSFQDKFDLLDKNDRIEPISYLELSECNKEDGPLLIDTRPAHEFKIGHLSHAFNIPMTKLCRLSSSDVIRELATDIDNMRRRGVYVICRRGNTSQEAVLHLRSIFADTLISFKDIIGGYEKWLQIVDTNFPMY